MCLNWSCVECALKDYVECALPKESQCRRATCSRIRPILTMKADSTFDTLTRQKFIEYQNTIMELKEVQNEMNCTSDSKDFQDAESVRSGNSHVTSQPMSFPTHPIPEGMFEAFIRIAATQRRAARYLGYIWYIRKRFCKSTCFLFSSLSSC